MQSSISFRYILLSLVRAVKLFSQTGITYFCWLNPLACGTTGNLLLHFKFTSVWCSWNLNGSGRFWRDSIQLCFEELPCSISGPVFSFSIFTKGTERFRRDSMQVCSEELLIPCSISCPTLPLFEVIRNRISSIPRRLRKIVLSACSISFS